MNDFLGAANVLIDRLETLTLPNLKEDVDYYNWVALPINEFKAGIEICSNYLIEKNKYWPTEGYTFMDVGCGIGSKLVLAYALGYKVFGVEWHKEYANFATKLCPQASIIITDAFNITNYDEVDVVYMYHLPKKEDLLVGLEKYVTKNMKPGSLFFAAGWTPTGLQHIEDQVWLI